jgi:hypothetical protein
MTLILSGTNGLSDVDGDASTPAVRGTDANTGIFFPAADTIAFAEGGVEAMRIDSSGNVLVGTTSAATSGTLNVVGSGYQPIYVNTTNEGGGGASFQRSGTPAIFIGTAGSSWLSGSSTADGLIRAEANMLFSIGNTERMRITSSGNVGIGTSSPNNKLDITSGRLEFNGATVASGFSDNTILINGSQSIGDDATVSPTLGNSALIFVAENNTGTGALFFASFSSATVVKLADPSGIFDVADTDGKVCVFKNALTPTYTVKNRRGSTLSFTISCISVSD